MFCTRCGVRLDDNVTVCPDCGNVINDSMQGATGFYEGNITNAELTGQNSYEVQGISEQPMDYSQQGMPGQQMGRDQQGMMPEQQISYDQQGMMPEEQMTYDQQGMPGQQMDYYQQGMPGQQMDYGQQGMMPEQQMDYSQQGMPGQQMGYYQQGMPGQQMGYGQQGMMPEQQMDYSQQGMPGQQMDYSQQGMPGQQMNYDQQGIPGQQMGYDQQMEQGQIYQQPTKKQQKTPRKKGISKRMKIVLPILTIFILVGAFFGYKVITDNSKYKDNKKLADSYMDDGDYEKAITYYRKALAIKPKDKECLTWLGTAQGILLDEWVTQANGYIAEGNYELALEELKDLPIKKEDSIYEEYQNLQSLISMNPTIDSIDTSNFPTIKATLLYDGNTKLTEDDIYVTEDEEPCNITDIDIKDSKATITFEAGAADYDSESRNIVIGFLISGLELAANASYDTPQMKMANINLVSTDLSNYPTVKAYFHVEDYDSGERIENLDASSFTIMESVDGGEYLSREIRLATILDGNAGVNIDLIADKSDSISDYDLEKIKSVMTEFVQNLNYDEGDKAEVLAFDSIVQQMCSYTNDSKLLVNGINSMSTDGSTAFYDAVYEGINHAALQGGARCVIAFTDGDDTASVNHSVYDVIDYANENQVTLYIIGVGDVYEEPLQNMASSTGGNYWYIDDLYDLSDIYNSIYQDQKDMYVVEYESDASLDAYLTRDIDVELMGNDYKGECSANFTPVKTIVDNGGVVEHDSRYEIIVEDTSWEEADRRCQEMGGHLVTITSKEEMDEVVALAETTDAAYIWMGGTTSYDNEGNVFGHWETGEEFSYSAWCKGEPSRVDMDGTEEWYLMLWNVKLSNGWSWNDQRNDPVKAVPAMSGKMAFICEYDS
ncbi:MAG TPA: VWA domain-containing protein [Lachnospiraceae bacterium]|nr:VWA domain-containing protein [Lachnospiraceae bacterium]